MKILVLLLAMFCCFSFAFTNTVKTLESGKAQISISPSAPSPELGNLPQPVA